MTEEHNKLFIIKRVKKIKKMHHGGSWKIAYADFVTAMMTFFLLMWLLAMMNKYQLEGIAEYFKKPITDAFKHQGLQVNRDVQKNQSIQEGIDSQKAKKEDIRLHKKYDEPNKASKNLTRAVSSLSDIEAIGIQAEDMKPGIKVFGMDKVAQSVIGNSVGQPDSLTLKNAQEKTKSIQQLVDIPNLQSGQLMKEKGLSDKKMTSQTAEEMKKQLEENLENNPIMRQYKNQLNFIVTADGLRIEIRDLQNKPMFSTGKTDFQFYAKDIMSWLAGQLNQYNNRVVITGHTDTAQYQREDYTNWELSADRANATRRELIKNGMQKEKIVRIIGLGETNLLNKSNGLDPSNRRIEITIMTDDAMKRLTP